jgi:hypothetical protein
MKNEYKLGIEKVLVVSNCLNSRHHPLPNLDEPAPNRLLIRFGNRLPNGRGSVRFVKSWCFLESVGVYANFCNQVLATHGGSLLASDACDRGSATPEQAMLVKARTM